jgi:1,4-alpha-glucan branching enzyme
MIRKSRSPLPSHVRVDFELPSCVWADRVFLTGDFNEWRQDDIPLVQDRSGVWRAVLDLPVGHEYQFRYLIDGQWRTDSHADGYSTNAYGSQNSVVVTNLPEAELVPDTPGLIREGRSMRPFASPGTPQPATRSGHRQAAA